MGSQGVLVVGSDTQRGFTRLDQVCVLTRRPAVATCRQCRREHCMCTLAGVGTERLLLTGCAPTTALQPLCLPCCLLSLQAWVSDVADKLEVRLERLAPGSGFKQSA